MGVTFALNSNYQVAVIMQDGVVRIPELRELGTALSYAIVEKSTQATRLRRLN